MTTWKPGGIVGELGGELRGELGIELKGDDSSEMSSTFIVVIVRLKVMVYRMSGSDEKVDESLGVQTFRPNGRRRCDPESTSWKLERM